MLTRIVKMTFRPEETDTFQAVFEDVKSNIRAFPGCEHLRLWRDQRDPNIFFTYSHWTGPDALENYRHSELFQATWAKTKPLFAERAQAWSVDELARLD